MERLKRKKVEETPQRQYIAPGDSAKQTPESHDPLQPPGGGSATSLPPGWDGATPAAERATRKAKEDRPSIELEPEERDALRREIAEERERMDAAQREQARERFRDAAAREAVATAVDSAREGRPRRPPAEPQVRSPPFGGEPASGS